jgi:hypothetical protein
MKCRTDVNFTPPTQLPHTFSYIVAILIYNHFESVNNLTPIVLSRPRNFGRHFHVNSKKMDVVHALLSL